MRECRRNLATVRVNLYFENLDVFVLAHCSGGGLEKEREREEREREEERRKPATFPAHSVIPFLEREEAGESGEGGQRFCLIGSLSAPVSCPLFIYFPFLHSLSISSLAGPGGVY